MKSPFLNGIKRGIGISIVLVIFWLLSDFFYFSKLDNKNKVNLESKQDASIGGDFDLIGKNGKKYSHYCYKILGSNFEEKNDKIVGKRIVKEIK